MRIASLAKHMALHLKGSQQRDKEGSQTDIKSEALSCIYWLINFTPKNKGVLTAGLNSTSVLEMVMGCMGKSGNLLAVLEIGEFIRFLFESVSSFG
jgi:hypothetical protein